jgi:prepilin peptidase CpaA
MHSNAWWPTVVVLAVATFTDLRTRRIPNWLVLPFMGAGIAVSGWFHGWHGVGQSICGSAVAALVLGLFFLLGGMGMGDVKLYTAVGAWIGPAQVMLAMVMTGLAGGAIALGWATFGGFLGELFSGSGDLILDLKRRGLRPHPEFVLANPLARKMPYAPAIAIGTLLSFLAR